MLKSTLIDPNTKTLLSRILYDVDYILDMLMEQQIVASLHFDGA